MKSPSLRGQGLYSCSLDSPLLTRFHLAQEKKMLKTYLHDVDGRAPRRSRTDHNTTKQDGRVRRGSRAPFHRRVRRAAKASLRFAVSQDGE